MYTAMSVKTHFNIMRNKIVCRKDVSSYGPQSAIDSVLSTLKAKGKIFCLAPGVYINLDPGVPSPSVEAVAEARLGAFSRHRHLISKANGEPHTRQITKDEDDSSGYYTKIFSSPTVLIYETDGCSSSFRIHAMPDRPGAIVYLRKRAPRKMYLPHTRAGQVIRELWEMGKHILTRDDIFKKLESLTKEERVEFQSSHRLMPGWLGDIVHTIGGFAANGIIQKKSIREKKYDPSIKLILIPRLNPLVLQLE
jgi:hypothetical protein